jgi:hypothetical protein
LIIVTLFLKSSWVNTFPEISESLKFGIDCCVSDEQAVKPVRKTKQPRKKKRLELLNKLNVV